MLKVAKVTMWICPWDNVGAVYIRLGLNINDCHATPLQHPSATLIIWKTGSGSRDAVGHTRSVSVRDSASKVRYITRLPLKSTTPLARHINQIKFISLLVHVQQYKHTILRLYSVPWEGEPVKQCLSSWYLGKKRNKTHTHTHKQKKT